MPHSPRLAAVAFVVLGAWGVHGGRYLLAPRPSAEVAHRYLSLAPLVLAGLLAVAVAHALVAAMQSRPAEARRMGARARLASGWAAFLGLYAVQESVEGLLTSGQLQGPVALLAHGGWTVLPLAAAAAALLALLLRGTEAALVRAWRPAGRTAPPPAPRSRSRSAPALVRLWPRAPELARHCCGRAPPVVA